MRCVRCNRPAPSAVCSSCTARISQGALEAILKMAEAALKSSTLGTHSALLGYAERNR